MSGFLGQIVGGLLNSGGTGQGSPIAGILQQVMGGQGSGGIAGLLQQFESAGLGQQARSWVGTGGNEPVAPEQLAQVFPQEQVSAWAEQAGTTPDALLSVLSQALPHMVDHATPTGTAEGAEVPDLQALLGRFMGNLGGGSRPA